MAPNDAPIAPSTATTVQHSKEVHKDGLPKPSYPSHPLDPLSADEVFLLFVVQIWTETNPFALVAGP